MAHEWQFLPYQLRWLETLQGDMVGDDGCSSSPIVFSPPEDLQPVLFQWDLATFTRLLSSVVKGAQLSYPDDWIQVTWDFLRGVDCPMAICDEILNCLQTNPSIQEFLTEFVGNSVEGVKGKPLSENQRTTPLQNNAGDCDLDTLWGSCLYTVQILNRLNQDFFEQIEALTNNQEMLAYVVGAIPILETLPIDEFIELADKVREFVAETYAAGYDVDYEQELACGLFCDARANECTLDMNVLTNFFFARAQEVAGFEDAFQTAITIVRAMASWEEVLGEQIVDTMMAANVGFMSFLNSSFGMDFGTFSLQAKAGIPDDDWQALCTDCDYGACYTQVASEATLIDGSWVADDDYGRFARADTGGDSASFAIEFDSPKTLVSFSFYTQVLGSYGSNNHDTGSVKIYLGATLLATLYGFDLPNNHGYLWSPPAHSNRGVVDSTSGAGTTFDRIVFEHTHASLRADVRGQVCIEQAPPASCADCGTFADETVSLDATFADGVWTPVDDRVSARSQSQYGGTYIAMSASEPVNEFYFTPPSSICSNKIVLNTTLSGFSGSIEFIVNGVATSYPISGSGAFITTHTFDAVPVLDVIVRVAAGSTGTLNATLFKIAGCTD